MPQTALRALTIDRRCYDAVIFDHDSGIAVAYNVWQYYQVSGDVDYLVGYGAA